MEIHHLKMVKLNTAFS